MASVISYVRDRPDDDSGAEAAPWHLEHRSTKCPDMAPMTRAPARAEHGVLEPRRTRAAMVHGLALSSACLISYWLTSDVPVPIRSVSRSDELLGGTSAIVATLFVYRNTYQEDLAASRSWITAIALSFALCLGYLLILPPHPWGTAVLIGVGTVVLLLLRLADDVPTGGITTAVVMVAAALSPHDAWKQPILRLADTLIGIAVGVGAAYLARRMTPRVRR
jgi:uncharacterized membrane protein YccC